MDDNATLTIYWDTQDSGAEGWAYQWRSGSDIADESGPIRDLGELLDALKMGGDVRVYAYAEDCWRGMDCLPVFGSDSEADEPNCPEGVWSYDDTHYLVGTCAADYCLEERC